MPLPGDLTTITVTATYENMDGSPSKGTVTFAPNVTVTDSTGHVIFPAGGITATLASGALSIVVPCTDNANTSPLNGWAYSITEAIVVPAPLPPSAPSAVSRSYTVLLPSSLGSSVDLSTVAPTSAPTTVAGAAGGDLAGTYPNPSVIRVRGITVSGTAPSTGQVLTATSSSAAAWQAASLSGVTVTGTPAKGQVLAATSPSAATWEAAPVDWLNAVTGYGADPTGVANSTTAIQNALNAATTGQTVYLPAGTYSTAAPLVIPPTVTLTGPGRSLAYYGGSTAMPLSTAIIKPSASFATATYDTQVTAGVLVMLSQVLGNAAGLTGGSGYGGGSGNQAIRNITIDGRSAPASTNGIEAWGPVWGVTLEGVGVYGMTGTGLQTNTSTPDGTGKAPDFWQVISCHFAACGGGGANMTAISDSYFVASEATGNTGSGWTVTGSNIRWAACKAEFNTQHGWSMFPSTGGGQLMTACGTDTNTQNGILVQGTTYHGPLVISGGKFHADGADGNATRGAVNVTGAAHVIVSGVFVAPDTTGGGTTPAYGVTATGSNGYNIQVAGSEIYGATAALNNGGTGLIQADSATLLGTGNWGTQSTTPVINPAGEHFTLAQDLGYVAWNYDPVLASSGVVLAATSGNLSVWRVPIRQPTSVTGTAVYVATAGGTLTSARNFIGVYSSAGTLIGTSADQTTAWGGTGLLQAALTGGPFVVQPPFVWVVLLWTGTTSPSFERGLSTTNAFANGLLTASTARYGTYTSGGPFTALPASITPASISLDLKSFWVALY